MEQIVLGEILIDFDKNEDGTVVYKLEKAYSDDFEKPENADFRERLINNVTEFHAIFAELVERM